MQSIHQIPQALLPQAILIAVTIIASGLLDLVYLCNVLSMGQLPYQVLQPCTHNGFAQKSLAFAVKLASTMLEVGTFQTTLV